MKTPEEIALYNCESEPIHIPGRVQSFGGLIGFDLKTMTLEYKSQNFDQLIAQENPLNFGDSVLEKVADRELVHAIRGSLGLPTITTQRERLGTFTFNESPYDAALHVFEETAVLELEPLDGPDDKTSESISRVRAMLASLDLGSSEESLLDSAVNALRALTGFDRVMGYRFLMGGDGEVAAEAKSPSVDAYLGLRYPAYDIPPQVRKIALRMPFRMIADIQDPHVNIHSSTDKPLDLTMCHLRGVSPIHVEYLTNMGVRATMNVSIIVRGELWGLFAFHHYRPKRLSPEHRSICELFGHLVSLQLQQQIEGDLIERRKRAQSTRSSLTQSGKDPFPEVFQRLSQDIAEVVSADGIALVQESTIETSGDVPGDSVIRELSSLADEGLFAIDSITGLKQFEGAETGKTAGALVTQVDSSGSTFIVYFRNEILQSIRWGGVPEKHIEYGPNGPRLHPRASFSEYSESVSGRCEPWLQGDLSAAAELKNVILDLVFQDFNATREAWQKQKKFQDLLVAELNHRVKNILALIRSISRQTKDSADSIEAYTAAFEKRIAALSTAHDLIGGSGLQWARLKDLVTAEVKPYLNSKHNISISGEPIGLRTDVAPIMALVIHELATNSAKHGALSLPDATLDIGWSAEAGGVAISWDESAVVGTKQPSRRGFGLTLVEKAIPYECGGEAKVVFEDDGIKARLWLPAETTTILDDGAEATFSAIEDSVSETPVEIARDEAVLVVEDNVILAMEMDKMLRKMGFVNVVTAPDQATGRLQHDARRFDFAILDINLGSETSFDLATALVKGGVPFAFASGYDKGSGMPKELTDIPRLTKPVDFTKLKQTIDTLLGK